MKKRYVDVNRIRKMKKIKFTEKITESAFTFMKFLIVWTLVVLADFILEFRLEYLWPCWLFLGSVYSTFHCHGLVICAAFVCAAFTLDIFCFIFVPLNWLFFGASTYVLFNYIWHTEKGICMSTVTLWILLVYTEASLRLKDLKNSHANLSHLFAAHCIGYPVVYLGFDATCYFSSIFKMRTQKAVQNVNDFHVHLLQQSLPPGIQCYPKSVTDGNSNSKWKPKPESAQYQCQSDTVTTDDRHTVNCLQIHSEGHGAHKSVEPRSGDLNHPSPSTKTSCSDPRELTVEAAEGAETSVNSRNGPQDERSSKAPWPSKSSPPKARCPPANTSVGPTAKGDKKQKHNSSKAASSPIQDTTEKNVNNNHNPYFEQIAKLEQEFKRLKVELQTSRQTEQELRSHVCNLTNSERSLTPEVALLRQSNDLLQSKILCVTKTKQRDKQTSAMLEKKTRAETEARLSVEKLLAELQAQKLEEAASSARSMTNRQEQAESLMLRKKANDLETEYKQLQLEFQGKESHVIALEQEVEAMGRFRCVEQETEVLLSALSALQEKAQHLEYNLSAETRIKLDLFSALGDARRQLEIAQGSVMKQDKEIGEMKQKIAEVMAVSPGMSYLSPRPAVPQYLTKFLNSEHYMLNPRALMYQCLKK